MLEIAKNELLSGGYSCVSVKDGNVAARANGKGLAPLLDILKQNPENFKGASVADRVIGRAAAAALIVSGAAEVYGVIMSRGGRDFLEEHGVCASCGTLVDIIENRTKTGMCPMEQSSFTSDDPQAAFDAVLEFIRKRDAK